MMHILYLGSKSSSRRMLLDHVQIPYQVVPQNADETQGNEGQSLSQVTQTIASHKMEHVVLPAGTHDNQKAFVLTADTLSQDATGAINGKPTNHADAIAKIKAARNGMRTGTAFCVQRRVWRNNTWHVDTHHNGYVEAYYEFIVPDAWLERYFDYSDGLQGTQAIAIEEYGLQFLKSIQGSFTTIVGLPLFEVRNALEELGFFN